MIAGDRIGPQDHADARRQSAVPAARDLGVTDPDWVAIKPRDDMQESIAVTHWDEIVGQLERMPISDRPVDRQRADLAEHSQRPTGVDPQLTLDVQLNGVEPLYTIGDNLDSRCGLEVGVGRLAGGPREKHEQQQGGDGDAASKSDHNRVLSLTIGTPHSGAEGGRT